MIKISLSIIDSLKIIINYLVPYTTLMTVGLVLSITTLTYSNIFPNQFIADDVEFIQNWKLTRSWDNWLQLLVGVNPTNHVGVFRPIRNFAYLVAYQSWGVNIWYYHLFALSIHLLSTLFVMIIVHNLLKSNLSTLIGGMTFGLHPVHVESITFITSSFDILGALFGLGSFYTYLLSNRTTRFSGWYLVSGFLFILAVYSNEICVSLIGLFFVYERIYSASFSMRDVIKKLWPFLVIVGIYLSSRFFLIEIASRREWFDDSIWLTYQISIKSLAKYIYQLIFPYRLSFNHVIDPQIQSYSLLEFNLPHIRSQSISQFSMWTSITTIGTITILGLKYPNTTIRLGLLWILLTLLPVINLVPGACLYCERYLYLPSVGLSLVLAVLVSSLIQHTKSWKLRALIVVFIMIILSLLAIKTYKRNDNWRNSITFWEQEVRLNPTNSVIYFNLATSYQNINNLTSAQEMYQKAIIFEPNYTQAYLNLGTIYETRKLWKNAEYNYLKALQLDPNNLAAHNNLGNIYNHTGRVSEALKAYSKALKLDPKNQQIVANIRSLEK